jgi:succinate dehydrogenase / fumarate reductase cytochrome b subunit
MSTTGKKSALQSSIGQKFVVALSGLFLITFLIVHLTGNLMLFKSDHGESFNAYASFMKNTPIIWVAEVILFGGFAVHIFLTLRVQAQMRAARPVRYKVNSTDQTASFASRFMLISGLIVLTFFILHLIDFFFSHKVAEWMGFEQQLNIYQTAVAKMTLPWRGIIYILAMGLLGMHLSHGFRSAFQTLGLQLNSRLGKRLNAVGLFLAVVLAVGFAAIPAYMMVYGKSILEASLQAAPVVVGH